MAKKVTPPTEKKDDDGSMRLNKYIAHCGICSRRQANDHIVKGAVTVNGKVNKEPGHRVQKGDVIQYNGEVVRPVSEMVYILLNKPKNIITTNKDEKGRRTVLDIVGGSVKERIYPVGRLDRDTTGLLLLTNDGELAKKLSHPSFGVRKLYHVTCDKVIKDEDIHKIANGLKLEDGLAPVDNVSHVIDRPLNEAQIEVHIGRNRIVRRIFAHLGYKVVKLDRIRYAGLTKKNLGRGRYRSLTSQELLFIKHFNPG